MYSCNIVVTNLHKLAIFFIFNTYIYHKTEKEDTVRNCHGLQFCIVNFCNNLAENPKVLSKLTDIV